MASEGQQLRTEVSEMTRKVGELTGAMEALQRQVGALLSVWQTQDNSATEGRRALYNKVDGLASGLASVTANVVHLTQTIAEDIEPIVKDYKTMRDKVSGGIIVLIFIGAAIFGFVGFMLRDIWSWVRPHIAITWLMLPPRSG